MLLFPGGGLIPIAADDCILFLWATVPMLPQALELMHDWGFQYRSHVPCHETPEMEPNVALLWHATLQPNGEREREKC
jgi:N6-adenosine-specific RNA methylase IME4